MSVAVARSRHHGKEVHDHSSHDKADLRETSPPRLVVPVHAMSAGCASGAAVRA